MVGFYPCLNLDCELVSQSPIICNSYIFLSLFLGLGFLIYWKWKNKKNNSNRAKQVKIILLAFSISLLLLAVSQIFFYFIKNAYVHEIVPLFVPIPIIVVLFAVMKYQFMQERDEDIIMEQFRTKIVKFLSIIFFAGSIYVVIERKVMGYREMKAFFEFSAVLCLFGVIIFITKKICTRKSISIIIYSILVAVTIPLVTLQFWGSSAITVWAFPFIIMIASVLLYDSIVFIMVTTTTLITQIYMWIFIPVNQVSVNERDYLGRIVILITAAILVDYINRVYIKRIRQLSNNMKDHDLLFQVSTRIIDINSTNKREKLLEIMELIGNYCKADRVYIYHKSKCVSNQESEYFIWEKEKRIDQKIEGELEVYERPWWKKQFKENGLVVIEEVEQLPINASFEMEVMRKQGAESLIAVPITGSGIQCGALRIDYSKIKSYDSNDNVWKTLITIGNIIGKAEEKNQVEVDLENMAYYDQLTQIPNRNLFGKYVEQWIRHSKKTNNSFCVFFLDIDSFKNINEISGYRYGDRALIKIAEKIENCLRKTDILCRFGADEFLVMIHHINSKEDAQKVVQKIMQQFAEPIIVDEKEVNITLSVGIAVYPEDGTDRDTLIKNADIAMYNAKCDGKNRFLFCSEQMKVDISRETTIINCLHGALEKKEFKIVYQPQVQTSSSKVIAAEALIRWNNPILGSVSPMSFIPLAEKSGLIIPIGEWVLKESCKQNRKWQDAGYPPIRIAVNVSMKQLLFDGFSETVKKVLEEERIDPQYLEIEITESASMQESDVIIETLSELKELGVSIAIDDFGVEYSSLNRIKELPIDRIKLDMHFIRNVLINEKERQITETMIQLANKLKLKVIAEGVEEKEQFLYLKDKNCDEIQGYYFYRPLSAEDMEKVLIKQSE